MGGRIFHKRIDMRSSASSLRLAGAAILLFATVAPAVAADTTERAPSAATADTGAAPAAKPAKKEERKICRAEGNTGSNLPKKICLTAREWRDRANIEFEK